MSLSFNLYGEMWTNAHRIFDEHINDYCQMNQAMFKFFLDNKELLERIINRNPKFKNELENWILEYTEFTP